MRPSKRAQRKTDKAVTGLKDFLIAMGQDPDKVEKAFDEAPMHSDEKMLQAEGVLLHLLKPARFISKKCKRKECGETFGTSYRAVAYCSDNCRAKDLEAQTGIRWNPHTDRYRNLDAERPLVIGPQAYQRLIEFARYILAENNIVVHEEINQNHLPEQNVPTLVPAESEPDELDELVHQSTAVLHTIPDISPQQSNGHVPQDQDDPFGF